MKKAMLIAAVLLGCTFADTIPKAPKMKIGVGVGLNTASLYNSYVGYIASSPLGYASIYVPVMPTPDFRIEPDVGFINLSSEEAELVNDSTTKIVKTNYSMLRVAVGLFYIRRMQESVNLYIGGRAGISSLTSKRTTSYAPSDDAHNSEIDKFIGVGGGGEYIFGSHISLGCEVQANYISYGNPTGTSSYSYVTTRKQNSFSTNTLLFVRIYL